MRRFAWQNVVITKDIFCRGHPVEQVPGKCERTPNQLPCDTLLPFLIRPFSLFLVPCAIERFNKLPNLGKHHAVALSLSGAGDAGYYFQAFGERTAVTQRH